MVLPKNFLSVRQLTMLVRSDLEQDEKLSHVWVRGEVSNFKEAHSGHLYFSLKDEEATLRCVMFKNSMGRLRFTLEDGMEILVQGKVSVFEAMGTYQLY